MIRVFDIDRLCLHLVYEIWDSMIEKVKLYIYKKQKLSHLKNYPFYDAIYQVLIARWTKSDTPLHCLAHSLNPSDDFDKVYDEYAQFLLMMGPFEDPTSLSKRYSLDPRNWRANFDAKTPFLQSLAFKLFGQSTSFSCCERNWSTYFFIYSLERNRLNPNHVEDLVYIHNNLCLLSRNSDQEDEETKMWDASDDAFDSMEDVRFLEFAELSLDEPKLENELITNNVDNA
ncbi:hypothetical protein GmHk_19G055701 [Glycine max]|nr:hypothetical protein GmHk_19G055701 [Glycine max]